MAGFSEAYEQIQNAQSKEELNQIISKYYNSIIQNFFYLCKDYAVGQFHEEIAHEWCIRVLMGKKQSPRYTIIDFSRQNKIIKKGFGTIRYQELDIERDIRISTKEDSRENRAEILEVITELRLDYKIIIKLLFYYGWPMKDVADLFGVTSPAITFKRDGALKTIKWILKNQGAGKWN